MSTGTSATRQQGQLILTCPTCRQVTPVPASGVAGLQADFRANQLLEIMDEEWKECATAQVARSDKVPGVSSTILTPQEHITVFCPQHDGKIMELYCETCEETICLKCVTTGGSHYRHNYEELNEVCQRVVSSFLNKCENIIEQSMVEIDASCDEISKQRTAIEEEVNNTDIVNIRKTELISQLYQLSQAKLKSLAAQRDQIESIQAQLNRHLHSMRETSHQPEAMLKNITAVREVKELASSIKLGMLVPANMKFYTKISDSITDRQSYGLIIAGSLPFKCHFTELVTPVGAKSTALLETVDSYNQPLKVSMDAITCELVSEMTGTRVEVSVKRRGQSQYQISYKPTIKGRHLLHIKVEGQHISESPFLLSAWSSVVNVIPILTISGLKVPYGVAVNQKGDVIVADWGGHCVSIFSPSGERLQTFGTRGSGLGQFEHPCGVAVDGEENIFVADTENYRIQKFTAQGEFLTAVGTQGTGTLFNHPCGITFNTNNGRVYVAESRNHRIQILSGDLINHGAFGKRGSGMGYFDNPQHVACDSTGNVYVTDHENHRIQVFTAEGKFLRMFGSYGEGRGELKKPCGIAIDSSDRVYVSDWDHYCVSVFSPKGQFVRSFGSAGKGPGQFLLPSGIAIDSSGVVHVCDANNHRVQLF